MQMKIFKALSLTPNICGARERHEHLKDCNMNKLIVSNDVEILVYYLRRWSALDLLRSATFISAFLLAWVSLAPFGVQGGFHLGEVTSGNQTSTYVIFGLFALLAVTLVAQEDRRGMASLITPGFFLLSGWLLIAVLFSLDPATSVRRFALTACVTTLSATVILLPKSKSDLTWCFSISAFALLLICYGGLLFAPHLAIHLATDALEPELAGNWRGSFGHKNEAAAIMAMLVFIGIYIARSGNWISGIAVVSMSSLFLFFSAGKSSLALCAVVLLITSMTAAIHSLVLRTLLLIVPLLVLNMLGVGTVMSTGIAEVAKLLPLDTTFTGRTDIWTFAVQALQERWVTGYGFDAFWGSRAIWNLPEGKEWAAVASHSHNSYLDIALGAGLPGLGLVVWVLVISPLKNFYTADCGGNGGPLTTLLLRIWLFGLFLGSFESFFFERADPIWFTFMVAVFGLHYLARFKLKDVL